MIEDYYEKYQFLRDPKAQQGVMKNKIRQDKKLYEAFKKDIQKNQEKLVEAQNNGDLSEEKRIAEIIEKSNKSFFELGERIALIESVIPEEQDSEQRAISDDEITNAYFKMRYKERIRFLENEYNKLMELPESQEKKEKIKAFKERVTGLVNACYILGNTERRNKYHKELDHQKYLEYLERNRQARMQEEEKQVKSVLGERFNPDMSSCKKQSDSYSWRVCLYEQPEKLFVGTSNYDKTPQINQEIYAYRYGSFEYGFLLKDNGEPTYTDELCEIIGITKKAIDGREVTNFVIAPLRYVSGIRAETIGSRKNNITNTSNQSQDLSKKAREFLKNIFSDSGSEQEKVRGRINPINRLSREEMNPQNYTRVFILESEKYHIPEEDREFFANIYLSDYLINNAVKNNAHYLGTYDKNKTFRNVAFDLPMEDTRVGACFFAQNNPGTLVKKSFKGEKKVTIENIDVLFDKLRINQLVMAAEEMKKPGTKIPMSDIKNAIDRDEY